MSRSKPRATTSVSLFPFLAVLVCAMGALIFLLIVITQRIGPNNSAAGLQADSQPDSPVILSSETIEISQTVLSLPPLPENRPVLIVPEQQPVDPNIALSRTMAHLRRQREDMRRKQNEKKNVLLTARDAMDDADRKLSELQQQVEQTAKSRLSDVELTSLAEEDLAGTQQRKIDAEQRLKHIRRNNAHRDSRYSIVPFDGKSGTTRRPILIECTSDEIRFLPENVSLGKSQWEGFTVDHNPVLAGAQALVKYWSAKDRQQAAAGAPPEKPYVLLLVRPNGSMAYYAATAFLSELDTRSGYELLEKDFKIALPKVDENARRVCRRAVRRMLERKSLYASSSRGVRTPDEQNRGSNNSNNSNTNNRGIRFRRGSSGGIVVDGETDNWFTPSGVGKSRGDFEGLLPSGKGKGRSRQGGTKSANRSGGPMQRNGAPASSQFLDAVARRARMGNTSRQSAGKSGGGKTGEDDGTYRVLNLDALEADRLKARVDRERNSESSYPKFSTEEDNSESQRSDRRGYGKRGAQANAVPDPDDNEVRFPTFGLPPREQPRRNRRSSRSANRRWGLSNRNASIGFERDVKILLDRQSLRVGSQREIPIDGSQTTAEFVEEMLEVIDREVRSWGRPPVKFYWVPSLKFSVKPGGDQNYERLKGPLQKFGLRSTLKQITEPEDAVIPIAE